MISAVLRKLSLVLLVGFAIAQSAQAQTYTVLYSFTNGADGSSPHAGVIRDAAGNLYGTTYGAGAYGNGTVFKLSAAGKLTVLYSFSGPTDGARPRGVLLRNSGNLYGTTENAGPYGGGTLFKLDKKNKLTVLHGFGGSNDGSGPYAGVVRDSAGNLYGTTNGGGLYYGTVYKLDPAGNETVLYEFTGYNDGAWVSAGLIRDTAGNLYGTTYNGGPANAGTVYKLDPAGNFTSLYGFSGGADGSRPFAGLVRAGTTLYGTTRYGGTSDAGTVFKIDKKGKETVLYSFTGGTDGANPQAGLLRDAAGNLYGTTFNGGAYGAGTVFKLDKTGKETVLYSFTNYGDGGTPFGDLIRDPAGNLYGTTWGGGHGYGVVFKLTP